MDTLQACKTIAEFKTKCNELQFEDIRGEQRYLVENKAKVDTNTLDTYPPDTPLKDCFPTEVIADGDCLPSCGNVFAFGTIHRVYEIRTRIVKELATHDEYYLNEDNLRKGHNDEKPVGHLLRAYAMYSEEYIPGVRLDQETIRVIFEHEAMKMAKPRTYMGMWQMMALSTVLQVPLHSVYPNLGNPVVRSDLNRKVKPRVSAGSTSEDALGIIWTSTRQDMNNTHWVPNHFEPLFSLGILDIPPPEEILGKYVLVHYEGRLYPGLVADVGSGEVLVDVIHAVGNRTHNCFFWPKSYTDKHWFECDSTLAIIPPPQLKTDSRHFEVDTSILDAALLKLRLM